MRVRKTGHVGAVLMHLGGSRRDSCHAGKHKFLAPRVFTRSRPTGGDADRLAGLDPFRTITSGCFLTGRAHPTGTITLARPWRRSQLALVLGGIELSLRLRDKAVRTKPPLFEAADPDKSPRTAGTAVGSGQRPVECDQCTLHSEIIHLDHEIGKSGHEPLRGADNRFPTDRGGSIVDF